MMNRLVIIITWVELFVWSRYMNWLTSMFLFGPSYSNSLLPTVVILENPPLCNKSLTSVLPTAPISSSSRISCLTAHSRQIVVCGTHRIHASHLSEYYTPVPPSTNAVFPAIVIKHSLNYDCSKRWETNSRKNLVIWIANHCHLRLV